MLGVVCRNLLSRVLWWGMLQGIQLSPESSELLPLLRAPQGGFLSCQPDCCVIQLSLQACMKVGVSHVNDCTQNGRAQIGYQTHKILASFDHLDQSGSNMAGYIVVNRCHMVTLWYQTILRSVK